MTPLGGRKHGHLARFPLTLSLAVGEISSAKVIVRPENLFQWDLYSNGIIHGFFTSPTEKGVSLLVL